MEMTNEEIVRDYNAAANKSKQIKVLADLNCVSPGEIRAVLAQAGVPGVKMPERIRPRKTASTSSEAGQKTPAAASFWQRMEDILNALPEKLPPEAEPIVQSLLQTLFADYLSHRLEGRVRDEP